MSSVTFSTAVGGDGSTVTDDNNATTGLREGGWKTRFVPCFTQQVAVANYIVTKAGEASTSASNAAASASAAAASYDSFDDRYLGSKTSDPLVDNDGNVLITGALYWNSSSSMMKVWTGSAWVNPNPAAGYLALSGGTMTGAITFAAGQTFTGSLPLSGGTMTGNIAFNSTQFGTNVATFLSTPSSANLAAALTDETGTGVNVFNNTPTLIAPILGTPTSGNLSNCTFPTLNQNTTGTATTATNLASGSAGTIPYQSASGTTAMLAAGTSGQVLTSSGAGAPTWGTPSSGALVLLSTVTASSSATVNIETTFNATYDEYVLKVTNLYTTTDSVNLMVRMKIGGSYLTTATYRSSIDSANLLNEIRLFSGNYLRNDRPANFNVNIHKPASTSDQKTIDVFGVCRALSEADIISNGGWNTTTASAMTGIQFYASSGTILSGTFRLYGVSKS